MEHTKTNESAEDYLENILILTEEKGQEIRPIDLVNFMNFSKPSISIALKKLENDGLVYIDNKGHIHLTPSGRDLAVHVYERHKILGSLFMALGVDEKVAYKDACKVEHDLSDETWEAIKNHYMENLKKD